MDASKTRTLPEVEISGMARDESHEVTLIVERAKAGDADAFAALMRLYQRRIIALGLQLGLRHDDALDACQDTFLKVFKYIRRFRSGESFFRWLYRIAIHAIYDHRKRSRTSGVLSIEDLTPSQVGLIRDAGPSLERRVESADLAGKLLEGLETLTRRERVVFVLRDLQEMDTEQIGRILCLSQITVRRHCMAARQKLRARLFTPRD